MGSGLAVLVDGTFDPELSEASAFEIHERAGQPARYAIRWPLAAIEGDLPLATDARIRPGSALSIRYQERDQTRVLVEGPVTGHALHIDDGGADSWIEALGADGSIEMDREVRSQVWQDGSDSDAVTSILGRYGMSADVEATDSTHLVDKHALVQRDSDLRFVQRLARRNGFLFWVTHDPLGPATGHFRLPPLDAEAPGTLVLNRSPANVRLFSVRFDVERPTSLEGLQLDLNSKSVMDLASASSPLEALGARDLLAITGDKRTVQVSAPVDDAGDLTARGAAALSEAGWFIQAQCETTRAGFGAVLRAHSVVQVNGAGRRHSGRYFVTSVRHLVDSTVHRMEVELVRNGWDA